MDLYFNPLRAQSIEECTNSIVFKLGSLVKSQVDNNGFSTLINNQQFPLNAPADGIHYLEAALIYTRDSLSDISNNYWTDTLNYQILKNGVILDTGTLKIKNQANEAFFEQVARLRIDSFPSAYTLKIVKMGSIVNQGSYLPVDIRVELRVKSFRIETLDTSYSTIILETLSGDKQVSLRWDMKQGADLYELEYVFIDSLDFNIPNNDTLLFANALRVETIHNQYTIDLAYPSGNLFFRVRSLGRYVKISGLINRIKYGDWSSSVSYKPNLRFSADKPYQFVSSFAEEGKNKKIVKYFDNTLRDRQEIVYLNDEKVSLVGESDYDAEGRKSLTILPVPDPNGTNDLIYKSKFNKDATSNSDAYNFTHFDNLNSAVALSTNSGAGKYYSSSNTTGGIYNDYIPDAVQKPFIQTKFLRDNTDRISAQGGVGSTYQLGSGKESKYYYITPSNIDLQKLFGTEVGDPSHYKKNVIIDPNGQGSVSYIDLTGKTIATALLGVSPINVRSLDPPNAQQTLTSALVTDNITDPLAIISSNQLFSEGGINSTYNFYYDLKPPVVVLKDTCKICTYTASFYVKDNMGMIVQLTNMSSGGKPSTYNSNTGVYTVTLNNYKTWTCGQGSDTLKQASFSVTIATAGDFTVFKKLESVPIDIKELTKIAKSNVDSSKIAQYVQDQNDTLSCFYNCNFYCLNYVMTDPSTKNLIGTAKDSAIAACTKTACGDNKKDMYSNYDGGECESIRTQMALQFEPQSTPLTFLQLLNNGNDTACVKLRNFTIIDTAGRDYVWQGANNILWDIDSNKASITKMVTLSNKDPELANKKFTLPNQLIMMLQDTSYYQDTWGDSLVNCHREYCWYKQCLATVDTTNFHENLSSEYSKYMQIDTALLHANPAYTNHRKDAASLVKLIIEKDPFILAMTKYTKCPKIDTLIRNIMIDSMNSTYFNRFSNKTDLLTAIGNKYSRNMLGYIEFVIDSAYCKNKPGGCTTTEREEELWSLFTSLYKELKTDRYYTCSDCVLLNDTNAIIQRSPIHDIRSVDSLIMSNKDSSNSFKATNICPGSNNYWLNIFKAKYYGLPQNKLDSLSSYLKSHCNQICDPYASMHCLVDTRTFVDTLSSYCGGSNTIKLGYYKSGVISRRNVSLYANNSSGLHPVWLGQSITPSEEKLFQFIPDSNIYTGNLPIRLTIYPENCGGPITDSIYVAVYQHAGTCVQYGPYYGGQIAIQKLYNQYGALILEWPHKFDPSFQSQNFYTIQFFKQSNTGTDQFSFQIETPMQFKTSDFHKKDTYLKLDALSNIYSFVKYNKNADTAANYVKDIWDCENSCKQINNCMINMLDSLKNYLNVYPDSIPKGVKNFNQLDGCYEKLSLTNYDSMSFFTFTPLIGSDDVINYFMDEYGGIINLKYAKIIDYKSTNLLLRQIDNYSIAKNSPDSLLRVKVLFKMLNAQNKEIFFQGYLIQFNKLKSVVYPDSDPCETSINLYDYYNDCRVLLKEKSKQQFKDIYDKRINEEITVLLSTANCMKGVSEKYTSNYSTREYQYTLYYYDQVGNLITTLPPEAVFPLSMNYFQNGKLYNPQNRKIIPLHNFNYASSYSYNTFNQVIDQKSPEQTSNTIYLYDYARRLRLSQNAFQRTRSQYSYSIYDYLDRVIEVGVLPLVNMTTQQLQDAIDADPNFPGGQSYNSIKNNVVTTIYSVPESGFSYVQNNLKGRVSYTKRSGDNALSRIDNKTNYSYDAHGNVSSLYQFNPELGIKTIEYSYDLISGNVKKLSYQRGNKDQYYQVFDYDSDNRLRRAYTSIDSILWDEDARYFYYRHGPLARVELGSEKVQGIDYFYTLQGWIKGTNIIGATNVSYEPGKDANNANFNINRYVARDAASYNIGYNSSDYVPISNSINFGYSAPTLTWTAFNQILPIVGSPKGLFNGNIAYLLNQFNGQAGFADSIAGQIYTYDQLHRIKTSNNYRIQNNAWNYYNPGYNTGYNYDRNGNLLNLSRYSENNVMDSLSYRYTDATRPNLLRYVTDTVGDARFNEDVDNQNSGNYGYDQIGNLTSEAQIGSTIIWDGYQKIRSVSRPIYVGGGGAGGSFSTQLERFYYDAMGERVQKKNNTANDSLSHFYVRDASGNILSIYNKTLKNESDQNTFIQAELNIFGSSRVGSYFVPSRSMFDNNISKTTTRYRNYRRYENSNHLGNVLAVISDRPKGMLGQVQQKVVSYEPDIVSAQDYYPFGQQLRNRTYPIVGGKNAFFTKYRYGFNDKEADVDGEINTLNTYDYGFRIYNPGIGRFLSVDPLASKMPAWSPYSFCF
ncbi:MAG: RHS repeat-associated core domain-containing protein, partial [Saprospiraceae bacterium]